MKRQRLTEQDRKFRFSPECVQKSIRRVIRLAKIEEPGNILYVTAEQNPPKLFWREHKHHSLHVREGGINHQNHLCIYQLTQQHQWHNHMLYAQSTYYSAICNSNSIGDRLNIAWGPPHSRLQSRFKKE